MNDDRVVDIFLILAFVVVLILKGLGIISISWLLIFSPLLFCLGIGIILAIVLGITFIISTIRVNKEK